MKPEAIDAILATNPRYGGLLPDKKPNERVQYTQGQLVKHSSAWRNLNDDAKLNAARAIVAERMVKIIEKWGDSSYAECQEFIKLWRELEAI